MHSDRVRAPPPPPTPRKPFRESRCGHAIEDPWRWLEDASEPSVRGWLAAQRTHARAVLDAVPKRDVLASSMGRRLASASEGAPIPWQGRLLVVRRRSRDEQPCLVLRDARGMETLLVDPLGIDPDGTTSIEVQALGSRLVAIAVRRGGADEAETWFLDVDARRWEQWRLAPAIRSDLHLLAGDRVAAWTEHGRDGSRLRFAFADGTEKALTLSGGRAFGELQNGWLLRHDGKQWCARRMEPPFDEHPIALPRNAHSPQIVDGGVLAIVSYVGSGDAIHLARGEPGRLGPWTEIVQRRRWHVAEIWDHSGFLVVEHVEEGRRVLRVFELDGTLRHVIRLPGWGVVDLSGYLSDPPGILLRASGWDMPPEIVGLDLRNGALSQHWRSEQPAPRRPIVTRQVTFRSRDGMPVPAWIAHAEGMAADGRRPVLVTCYGGFGVVVSPRFDPLVVEWLDLGGVVMLPCLRGGGELGRGWSKQATGAGRQRTFDDLAAAIEHLVREGWTRPDRVAVRGASNGALTCAALVTQRPELLAAAVLEVPLLDMTRHHVQTDGAWIDEYGDPESADDLGVLLGYSPLHRVRPASYPGVLLVTGDRDTRVPPWHARKMTAALQSASTSGRPILLHDEPAHGHSGSAALSAQVRRSTDVLAFLCWQLGISV